MFDPENLPFPRGLPEFQRIFPDDAACAAYLEAIRWRDGFICQWCGEAGEPYRFKARPHVLVCRISFPHGPIDTIHGGVWMITGYATAEISVDGTYYADVPCVTAP